MRWIILIELLVPFFAGVAIGLRTPYGWRQTVGIGFLAAPVGLIISVARLSDQAIIGKWYGPYRWVRTEFLAMALLATFAGFVAGLVLAPAVKKYRERKQQ